MGYTGGLKPTDEESSVESFSPPPSDPRPKPTYDDAIRYVTVVKDVLLGEPDKYQEILAVMHGFKEGSIEIPGVVDRMKVLLIGHPDLLHEFNRFLPWGYLKAHGPAGGCSHG